jgi:hypothetical protein
MDERPRERSVVLKVTPTGRDAGLACPDAGLDPFSDVPI